MMNDDSNNKLESINKLNLIELTGHSLSSIAPSATAALSITLVLRVMGDESALIFFAGGLITLLIAIQCALLARRYPSPGGIYAYIAKSLHPLPGLVIGFSLILVRPIAISVLPISAGLFIGKITKLTIGYNTLNLDFIISLLFLFMSWYVTRKGVNLSVKMAFSLELISISIILLICSYVIYKFGLYTPDIVPQNANNINSIIDSIMIILFFYGGYEAAGNLSNESRHQRNGPANAMQLSVVIALLFFVFVAYAELSAFQENLGLFDHIAAPINTIGHKINIEYLGVISDLAVSATFFSGLIAGLNSLSRVYYDMSKNQILPSFFSKIHEKNHTPSFAIDFSAAACLVMLIIKYTSGYGILKFISIFALFGALVAVLASILIIVSSVYALRKSGEKKWIFYFFVSLFTVPLLSYFEFKTFNPMASNASGTASKILLVLTIGVVLYYIIAKKFYPQYYERVLFKFKYVTV